MPESPKHRLKRGLLYPEANNEKLKCRVDRGPAHHPNLSVVIAVPTPNDKNEPPARCRGKELVKGIPDSLGGPTDTYEIGEEGAVCEAPEEIGP